MTTNQSIHQLIQSIWVLELFFFYIDVVFHHTMRLIPENKYKITSWNHCRIEKLCIFTYLVNFPSCTILATQLEINTNMWYVLLLTCITKKCKIIIACRLYLYILVLGEGILEAITITVDQKFVKISFVTDCTN